MFKNSEHGYKLNMTDNKDRKCSQCNTVKDITDFRKRSEGRGGYASECRVCNNLRNRKYYTPKPKRMPQVMRKPKSRSEYAAESDEKSLHFALLKKKFQARKDGYQFDLDTPFVMGLLEMQDHKCALTGDPIRISRSGSGRQTKDSLSIDRIDSNGGYTRDNVQLVSLRANIIKSNMSMLELASYCARILERIGRGN